MLIFHSLDYLYNLAEKEKLQLRYYDLELSIRRATGRGEYYILVISASNYVKCIGFEYIRYSLFNFNHIEMERKIIKALKNLESKTME